AAAAEHDERRAAEPFLGAHVLPLDRAAAVACRRRTVEHEPRTPAESQLVEPGVDLALGETRGTGDGIGGDDGRDREGVPGEAMAPRGLRAGHYREAGTRATEPLRAALEQEAQVGELAGRGDE